jgi:predicted SAM-dependent methyltransferase
VLSRRAKAAFYVAAGPLMRANAVLYRLFRAPRSGLVKVHLGPGQRHYLDGWLNVDANMFTARCDVWADLRRRLPFRDGTVDAFYSHHVVEHLPDLQTHFREVFRCLKPGGVYRVGGPDGDSAIAKFSQNDAAWFSDFPVQRTSIGGRLDNFLLCQGEHLTILTRSFLHEVMAGAGFSDFATCLPGRDTRWPALFSAALDKETVDDDARFPHTLIIEALKP